MSTHNRNSGGGGRNQKKSNSGNSGGGGTESHTSNKKTDVSKTEKEKVHPKPTAEQLRIAQITNSNTSEDPQMREKVATLMEMTQRSEEEVCCALNECDNHLERAVVFLLETLPVGAFETSSKKKKNKAANTAQDNSGDGDWVDTNANTDRREKSRNRSSNRGGRGGTDSRGWRGRETRENERNLHESRSDRDRGNDDRRREFRTDRWNNDRRGGGGERGSGRRGGGRGGGYTGRGGRSGGNYGSRPNPNEDHQEVELWDNTIAQNAEKQQNQTQEDAWGDWDNEEYVGSLKDSKVFTTSNLPNPTAASVVSGSGELSVPPGLEHHLGSSVLGASPPQQGSHFPNTLGSSVVSSGGSLVDDSTAVASVQTGSAATTPIMMYSAAVSSNTPLQQPQPTVANIVAPTTPTLTSPQYNSGVDTFSNSTAAASSLVQVQQQPTLKASATLSAEQSQYFNSLTSQNTAGGVQQQPMATYAQSASVQYPTTYANVFGSGTSVATDQTQLTSGQQPQVRRTRTKLPPPSKIPATAVEMPGDTLNNIGYLDVQFGGLDFGTDDSFDNLPDKFATSVTLDSQQQAQPTQQQLVQAPQDISNEYQPVSNVQQQQQSSLTSLQNAQMVDPLPGSYTQRNVTPQQQQQQVVSNVSGSSSSASVGSANTLEQLTKGDPYIQSNTAGTTSYQNSYQTSSPANKASNAYQPSATGQGYNNSSYSSVQGVGTYQPQSYGAYQPTSSYQQQQPSNVQNTSVSGATVSGANSSTQNIPVGGNGSNNGATANSNAGYLSTGYQSQQSAYQSNQSVYGGTGLSNNTGYTGNTSTSSPQYSNFSTNAKLKDSSAASSTSHYESVSSSNSVSSTGGSGTAVSAVSSSPNVATASNSMSSASFGGLTNSKVTDSSSASNNGNGNGNSTIVVASSSNASNNSANSSSSNSTSSVVAAAAVSSNKNSAAGAGGMVPNIQMVSQYIQTGLPYYQQPVYSYEDIQMMQQRVPHVQGYYDLNYTPTSLGAGRDNLGSVAYSTMTDGRFARTDNNSSPVSNVSSTMSQQAGSGGPMLNVPYAYFYGGNVMPGSFQYGTPAIYPQQIPAANTASGGQFPKPSYNTGYGSASYDTLSQASQDYTKGAYPSSVNQQTKSQSVANPPQAGTGTDLATSMYGKGHVALNKVNSYEKQNFHSGTPPPFNMPNTQTAGGTSAQPYGMYLQMPAAGHHNMIHQPIHQMDGRIHSSRRDSNSTGQRQQAGNQSKSGGKQAYSPSYWTGQN